MPVDFDRSSDESSGQRQKFFRRLEQGFSKSLLPSLPFSASCFFVIEIAEQFQTNVCIGSGSRLTNR